MAIKTFKERSACNFRLHPMGYLMADSGGRIYQSLAPVVEPGCKEVPPNFTNLLCRPAGKRMADWYNFNPSGYLSVAGECGIYIDIVQDYGEPVVAYRWSNDWKIQYQPVRFTVAGEAGFKVGRRFYHLKRVLKIRI